MHTSLHRWLLLFTCLCAAAGCTVQDPGIETDDVWECTTDADCISGYDCKGGLCAKHTNPPLCVDLDKDEAFVGEFCAADTVMDCEDTNAAIHPSAPELCNLKDDNCNDQIDEDIALACPLTNGVCAGRNAVQTCVDGNLVPPTCDAECPGASCLYGPDFVVSEGVAECHDSLDNDCDGLTDKDDVANCPTCVEGDPCGSTCLGATPEAQCPCKMGTWVCNPDGTQAGCFLNGVPTSIPFVNPELCGNNLDDDCTGEVDEAGCI